MVDTTYQFDNQINEKGEENGIKISCVNINMTAVKLDEEKEKVEEEEPVKTIKQKCVNCLKGPNLIKSVVVFACTAVLIQQISACVSKLINLPITTYTHFDFNKTIEYPSLTFCREPPYKFDKLLEYNLYAHPRFTSVWAVFNFSQHSLDEMWQETTYEPEEFFAQYGLNGSPDNVEIHSTLGFMMGRCYTMEPKVRLNHASKAAGYSITLQHHAKDVATSTSTYPPGYHVYVHYNKEPYTEVQVYNGGLVDYLYVNTGETIDVKLTVDEYIKISKTDDFCNPDEDYSANHCTSKFVWDRVGEASGCSGPWMLETDLPRCDNYRSMRTLISTYMNIYDSHSTRICPRSCHSYLYNAFVTERQKLYTWNSSTRLWSIRNDDEMLQSQLYVHFNSMMVSVYQERYNYDWNIFISDLGGSVGFLLGLSVIGLMTIVCKMWYKMISPFFKSTQKSPKKPSSITSSSTTAQIEDLYKNEIKNNQKEMCKNQKMSQNYNDWQLKNFEKTFECK